MPSAFPENLFKIITASNMKTNQIRKNFQIGSEVITWHDL